MSKDSSLDHGELSKLPNAVAISWGLAKEPQRGPKRELSISQIVQAAIELADQDGLAAVSMSRVAASLGYTAMSLYRYLPSKDDLLLLMQDAVGNEIAFLSEKQDEDWRESMREFVEVSSSIFIKHPWFGDIPISGVPLMPNHLRFVDWALRTMRHFPLNDYEKMGIVLLLSSYARSIGMLRRDMVRAMKSGANVDEFHGRSYTNALKQLVTAERFPYLYSVVQSGIYTEDNEETQEAIDDFDFGLERILDGIAAYIDTRNRKHSGSQ